MLKILEQCLKSSPELNESLKIQQIIKSNLLHDFRAISGKALLN